MYYAWSALMKGDSHVVIADPTSNVATAQAALGAGGGREAAGADPE